MNDYLTASDVARVLRIRASKVSGWIRNGTLPAADVSERPGTGRPRWRIARADLDQFLQTRQPIPPVTSRRRNAAKPTKDWLA